MEEMKGVLEALFLEAILYDGQDYADRAEVTLPGQTSNDNGNLRKC
ncbi:hypothetical protein [Paenibacillus illinoisensis]|nr:hypothetical protein [Paenibacillus illinoisensis]MBY0215642.1 hypothetical protein [Paenibacillus illinoisensis]